MPLYEYRCGTCKRTTEAYVPVTALEEHITCGYCGHTAYRVYSSPAIHFKGSGFHNTDYKRKREHGAKEEKPPQDVKKDADKRLDDSKKVC